MSNRNSKTPEFDNETETLLRENDEVVGDVADSEDEDDGDIKPLDFSPEQNARRRNLHDWADRTWDDNHRQQATAESEAEELFEEAGGSLGEPLDLVDDEPTVAPTDADEESEEMEASEEAPVAKPAKVAKAPKAVKTSKVAKDVEYTSEIVKQIRGSMGQVEFAEKVGVSQGTISLVEAGRQKVSKKLKSKLEDFQAKQAA